MHTNTHKHIHPWTPIHKLHTNSHCGRIVASYGSTIWRVFFSPSIHSPYLPHWYMNEMTSTHINICCILGIYLFCLNFLHIQWYFHTAFFSLLNSFMCKWPVFILSRQNETEAHKFFNFQQQVSNITKIINISL